MAVLFLHPLALGLLVGLLVYVWLVWRGTFRRWFGRGEPWTVVAWPLPLLAIGVPPLAGALLWFAGRLGVDIGDGDVTDALLYATAYLVPAAVFAGWPPRWLLPGWARRRLTPLPSELELDVPAGAMSAMQSGRGHGSRARWVWLVDGVAGQVWIDGRTLRFRSATSTSRTRLELDEELGRELHVDGEQLLATSQGGWWGRGWLDIDLDQVDRIRIDAVVPWHRDGLLTVEAAGPGPVNLWVADIHRFEQALAGADTEPTPGPDQDETQ